MCIKLDGIETSATHGHYLRLPDLDSSIFGRWSLTTLFTINYLLIVHAEIVSLPTYYLLPFLSKKSLSFRLLEFLISNAIQIFFHQICACLTRNRGVSTPFSLDISYFQFVARNVVIIISFCCFSFVLPLHTSASFTIVFVLTSTLRLALKYTT